MSYPEAEKKEITDEINKQLESIKKRGRYLNKDFEKKINNIKIAPVELKLSKDIMEIAKDAYYDTIKNDFKNEKHDILHKFLNELQERLIALAPNNKKRKDEINEKFDVELIMQMVENKAFEPKDFMAWSNYLYHLVSSSQAAADDKETEEWKKEFDKECYSGETEYHQLITKLLRFIMDRVEKIEKRLKYSKLF